MLLLHKTLYFILSSSTYRLMTIQIILSLILWYILVILLKLDVSVTRALIWGSSWDMKWPVDFIASKTQSISFDLPNKSAVIDVETNRSNLYEKPSCDARVIFLLEIGMKLLQFFIVKIIHKKIRTLIRLWCFFFLWLLVVSVKLPRDLA